MSKLYNLFFFILAWSLSINISHAQGAIDPSMIEFFDTKDFEYEVEGVYSVSITRTAITEVGRYEDLSQMAAHLYIFQLPGESNFQVIYSTYSEGIEFMGAQGTLKATASPNIFIADIDVETGHSFSFYLFYEAGSITWSYDEVPEVWCSKVYQLEGSIESKRALCEAEVSYDNFGLKVYPISNSRGNSVTSSSSNWRGNGSGILVHESGFIVTNYHVIEGAKVIQVDFVLNGLNESFSASVVEVDKTNDLAILKIRDPAFNGVAPPPFAFKFRPSEVGTQIYAYGYPMALNLMGREVKVTDGIISSKTGFDGDITTYQISAAIQGGNSGGPLFDSSGNLIGINSSGLGKDIADNVGYSIKSSYVRNLFEVLPNPIQLPNSQSLKGNSLIEQVAAISPYVALVKIK